jgi:hypothetical protein
LAVNITPDRENHQRTDVLFVLLRPCDWCAGDLILPARNLSAFFKYYDDYRALACPQGRTIVFGFTWTLRIPKTGAATASAGFADCKTARHDLVQHCGDSRLTPDSSVNGQVGQNGTLRPLKPPEN